MEAICPLVTVLPTRVDLSSGTISSLVKAVQKDVVSALPFENVPLGKVQGWVKPGHAVFEMVFSYIVRRPDLERSNLWEVLENALPQPDVSSSFIL